jgi:hypothetical protein
MPSKEPRGREPAGLDDNGRVFAMERQVARLVCEPTSDDQLPVTIEVALKDESIEAGKPFLGWAGDLNDEFWPFVLHPDGKLDYGSEVEEDAERFIQTNIHQKRIAVGEVFTAEYAGEQITYAIKQIVPL